jgi:hypothetical protein
MLSPRADLRFQTSGSATFMHAMFYRAAGENRIITLIDGCDTFDVTGIDPVVPPRILSLRCHSAAEALKAADVVLQLNVGNSPERKCSFEIAILLDLRVESVNTTCDSRGNKALPPPSYTCVLLLGYGSGKNAQLQ